MAGRWSQIGPGGPDGIDRLASALDWVEPLALTEPASREAALVEAELLEDGDRMGLGDALVARVRRHNGARIVTRDGHFEPVDALAVDGY